MDVVCDERSLTSTHPVEMPDLFLSSHCENLLLTGLSRLLECATARQGPVYPPYYAYRFTVRLNLETR
jgi:hypothetical protein